jgi:hypothetical protein
MKVDKQVTVVIIIRFVLPVLRFVVKCGQKGHCHGEVDERQRAVLTSCCAQASCVFIYVQ